MNIVIKFLYKNVMEKKARSLLILVSIAVSSALFFATLGMSSVCQQMYLDQIVRWTGNSDIMIEVKDEIGEDQFFSHSKLDFLEEKLTYQIGLIRTAGLYSPSVEDMQYLDVVGTTLEDLNTYNTYELEEESDLESFTGHKIIISRTFAQKTGFSLGDTIDIKIRQNTYQFIVSGIAQQKGIFVNESNGVVVIVPREVLEEAYGVSQESNAMFLKLKDTGEMSAIIDDLADVLPNCRVMESMNRSDLSQAVNTVVMPFQVSAISVLFMSIFIIYTSFHLMMLERMPSLGTLRSIGLSQKKLRWLFILESIIWGAVGGILGSAIGTVLMYTIVEGYVANLSEGTALTITISLRQILLSIGMAIILTSLSAILPLFSSLRKSVKNIILNIETLPKSKKGSSAAALTCLLLIYALCVIIPHMFGASLLSMIITIVCVTIIMIVMVLVIPYLLRFSSKKIVKMSGNDSSSWLAVKNVSTSKSMLNIVRMLTISISSILIISSISNSISNTITGVYDTYHLYDISLSHRMADQDYVSQLNEIDGVVSSVSNYELMNVNLTEQNYYLNTLYGIEDEGFFDYMGAEIDEGAQQALENINSGRNIVLTKLLQSKLGLQVGDSIKLTIDNNVFNYTITGFIESSFKLGNIGFVAAQYLREDAEVYYYTNTYVKADKDANIVVGNIKAEFLEDVIFIQTLAELVEINQDLIVSIFRIINAYAILAVLIGIIGIFNCITVCFLERKKELALYRTVGMSKKRMKSLFIKESLFIGIFGIGVAFAGATGILKIVPYMLNYVFGNIVMEYNIALYLIFAVAGIAVMSLVSLMPIIRSSKLSIIESIKYE